MPAVSGTRRDWQQQQVRSVTNPGTHLRRGSGCCCLGGGSEDEATSSASSGGPWLWLPRPACCCKSSVSSSCCCWPSTRLSCAPELLYSILCLFTAALSASCCHLRHAYRIYLAWEQLAFFSHKLRTFMTPTFYNFLLLYVGTGPELGLTGS
jgi:hypothetical protein